MKRRMMQWKAIVAVVLVLSLSLAGSMNVLAAANSSTYAAVFDSTYYAAKYADLQAAFGNNEAALLNHFITCGMREGRQASAEFNVTVYKNKYPDLQAAFGDDLKLYYLHYINFGKAEGRTATGATPSATTTTTTTTAEAGYAQQVVELVNQQRVAYGLQPLTTTPQLMSAAQTRAVETVTLFSHTRPDGSSCFTILQPCGVVCTTAGENIAAGQTTPAEVVTAWMNSPGHRANILNGEFTHIGVGFYYQDGGYDFYWSQFFSD